MGEIAEMMLDGTLCEGCGEFIGDEGEGFPRYCSPQCAAMRGMKYDAPQSRPSHRARRAAKQNEERQRIAGRTHPCPDGCGRKFRSSHAAQQHARDAHTAAAH